MRKESRQLLGKSISSLILSIEHFNRPSDIGRVESTLIFMDHAFEMLLKAAILHKGGKIKERRSTQTIGFDTCVRRALSEGSIRFINEEQALTLQIINGLRDAAQHHLLEISEQQLYLHIQSGVTLFSDLLKKVFDKNLSDYLPVRVLPISTQPPIGLEMMMKNEVEEVRKIVQPHKRKLLDARARIKSLVILDKTIKGDRTQPKISEINEALKKARARKEWYKIFPGVAALRVEVEQGIPLNLRIVKKANGVPISLVPEGTPGAGVVAVRRVNELGYYSLGLKQVSEQLSLTPPKTLAIIKALRLQTDKEYYSEFRIGKSLFKRYSQKVVDRIKKERPNLDLGVIWEKYRPGK